MGKDYLLHLSHTMCYFLGLANSLRATNMHEYVDHVVQPLRYNLRQFLSCKPSATSHNPPNAATSMEDHEIGLRRGTNDFVVCRHRYYHHQPLCCGARSLACSSRKEGNKGGTTLSFSRGSTMSKSRHTHTFRTTRIPRWSFDKLCEGQMAVTSNLTET